MNDLINAIATIIASKYEHTIYINDIGEGFERPSFFIYLISDLSQAMNRWTYNTNVLIQIVYFAKWDEYNNVDTTDQRAVIEDLKHTFMSKISIPFRDKYARIKQINVDYTGDKDIFLQLNLDVTIGIRREYEALQNTQLMQEINFNTKE